MFGLLISTSDMYFENPTWVVMTTDGSILRNRFEGYWYFDNARDDTLSKLVFGLMGCEEQSIY
eukprot:CAMPEP_0185771960 /NCGR_PEP_ID=MMETSP1174-20130828/66168_1 /TAXON_ID=35687 /ORGANISM="Dictyocha speculum, Strain CCMP1381" /LENGTH=62 /DNA_ID=CAMNT_0028457999 /DNA_START=657 /DNA_END=845 /DNA_ORIENTATION=-